MHTLDNDVPPREGCLGLLVLLLALGCLSVVMFAAWRYPLTAAKVALVVSAAPVLGAAVGQLVVRIGRRA